jgi:hypothetical protein
VRTPSARPSKPFYPPLVYSIIDGAEDTALRISGLSLSFAATRYYGLDEEDCDDGRTVRWLSLSIQAQPKHTTSRTSFMGDKALALARQDDLRG